MKGFMSLGYFERRVKKVLTFILAQLEVLECLKEAEFYSHREN
ncbi:hypothetical protein ACIQWI_26635 [Peribacillus frigoritolerans]